MSPAGAAGSDAGARRLVVEGVRPEPDPAVLAAIVAALEESWPHPVSSPGDAAKPGSPPWRFSGRWWARPVALRRGRP